MFVVPRNEAALDRADDARKDNLLIDVGYSGMLYSRTLAGIESSGGAHEGAKTDETTGSAVATAT